MVAAIFKPRSLVLPGSLSLPGFESAAIKMKNIIKKFKTAVGEVTVLKGIDTAFFPGEFVGVIGKSGSGKSTLVNMLTGIDRPTSGEVEIGSTLVHHLSESDMARWRGINLGIVFQFYQLLPVLTLLENTMLPMDIANKVPPAQREERAMSLLKMVGLDRVAHQMPAAVSGGQQQAAAIARAMANDPPFIIADEPTGNLDSRTAENIFQIFEELVERGKTIIMVTHDPNLAQRTTRTLLLCDGEVIHPAVAHGLPWLTHPQMLRASHDLQVRSFQPGETILAPGQSADGLYVVAQGEVEVRSSFPHRTIEKLPAGQLFGQVSLLSGKPISCEVVAATGDPVEVAVIQEETVCSLLRESGSMRQSLLAAGKHLV
jgi:putative ABC transport system ATP-binding protein